MACNGMQVFRVVYRRSFYYMVEFLTFEEFVKILEET